MLTYWVLGKGDNIISPSLMMPAGVPLAQSPSLQRQSSHHSSLAAVVLGMMQNSKRNNVATTRKKKGLFPRHASFELLSFDDQQQGFGGSKVSVSSHYFALFHTHTLYIISIFAQDLVGVGPKS